MERFPISEETSCLSTALSEIWDFSTSSAAAGKLSHSGDLYSGGKKFADILLQEASFREVRYNWPPDTIG